MKSSPTGQARTKSKAKKKQRVVAKKAKSLLKPDELNALQDTFSKATADQEKTHLIEEHRAKMLATERLHQSKLQSIADQLHIQLYKIWNDMWLQRKKTLDSAYKEWLKILAS